MIFMMQWYMWYKKSNAVKSQTFTEYVAVAMIEIWRGTSNAMFNISQSLLCFLRIDQRVDSNRQGPYPLYISLYSFGTSPGFQKTKITSRGLLLSVIYIFVSTDLPHNELFFFHHKNCWWESIHGLSLGKIAVSYTTGAPSDEEEDADSPSPKKSPSNFRVTRLHGREMERSGGWDCRG